MSREQSLHGVFNLFIQFQVIKMHLYFRSIEKEP